MQVDISELSLLFKHGVAQKSMELEYDCGESVQGQQ